jgi:hypothetical protein
MWASAANKTGLKSENLESVSSAAANTFHSLLSICLTPITIYISHHLAAAPEWARYGDIFHCRHPPLLEINWRVKEDLWWLF